MVISNSNYFDAVVLGAGFYGCAIALYLARDRGLRRVALVEREKSIMSRASYKNQARVHNGYHYPRSFTTAYRSRCSLPKFAHEWPDAVVDNFSHVYAIARDNSKVTGRQFSDFCRAIGASLEATPQKVRELFEPRLIEATFLVNEPAFDATVLQAILWQELQSAGIEILLNSSVKDVRQSNPECLALSIDQESHPITIQSKYVFNCAYSGLTHIGSGSKFKQKLRHEIAELALVKVPQPLEKLGITVMDGPFFSLMPFPARNLHSLSHVRFTPHCSFIDTQECNPYEQLAKHSESSRFDRMRRDAKRFVPCLEQLCYKESLFELKTVLLQNDDNDGRPILFEPHPHPRGLFSIMGGKIDNIFDVLAMLDLQSLTNTSDCSKFVASPLGS